MDKNLLYRFFEGTSTLEEEQNIREWMDASVENKTTFLKERKLFDMMLLLGEEEAVGRVLSAKQFYKNRFFLKLIKIAAIVILTLGLNSLYHSYYKTEEIIGMQTISVPAGQRINLTLPDGTDVWLNARTTLQYPVNFNKDRREVILDGEAFFDVTRNSGSPFIVATTICNVEVLGTQFNIDAYADRGEFEATLMEGRIKVVSNEDSTQNTILLPNTKAYVQNGKLYVVEVDDYNPYRWKEGLICFKDESFEAIMKDFEKYYGLNIVIRNQEILTYYYTGKFRQTDGIDYALRVLQKDFRFNYKRDDDNQVIYIE